MHTLSVTYRDVDRTPYLFTLRHCAARRGLGLRIVRYDMSRLTAGPTGHDWGDLLLDGEIEVIAENYWGLQSYRARRLPLVCVASTASRWPEKLLAGPGVAAVDDLRGKRFALRSPGPQALLPQLWARDVGLGSSVEFVTYPDRQYGRMGHWRKVVEGECDACFVPNLYAGEALAAGLTEVPYKPYPFEGATVTLTTTEAVAERKRDAVQALVDAAFDATDLFRRDPGQVLGIMRSQCRELLAEHFGELDDAGLARLQAILRDELSELPVPTPEGVSIARRIRLGSAPELEHYNPMIMWDLSFARRAMDRRAADR
ncbi:ABC transporter substrate-binding protein [Dactylosporangium sp. CA-092794]|uniref:ABC transporter substrate-binding protein n=1 Tax=Dactylosporangium sp. CA-092794 TaxID=3239929 RepID=UPI003D8B8038